MDSGRGAGDGDRLGEALAGGRRQRGVGRSQGRLVAGHGEAAEQSDADGAAEFAVEVVDGGADAGLGRWEGRHDRAG